MSHQYMRFPFTADHVCPIVKNANSGRVLFEELYPEIAPRGAVQNIWSQSRGCLAGPV